MRTLLLLLTLFLVSCDVPPKPLTDRTAAYEMVLIDGCEFYEATNSHGGITKVDCNCTPASRRNKEWDNPEIE